MLAFRTVQKNPKRYIRHLRGYSLSAVSPDTSGHFLFGMRAWDPFDGFSLKNDSESDHFPLQRTSGSKLEILDQNERNYALGSVRSFNAKNDADSVNFESQATSGSKLEIFVRSGWN